VALVQAARHDPGLRRFFEGVAVASKMLVSIFYVLKRGEPHRGGIQG